MSEADWRAAGERVDTLIAASAAGGAVARERAEELVVQPAGLVHDLEQPFEAGAVEVDDQPDQFLGALARHPAAGRRGLQQGLDALPRRAEVGLGIHRRHGRPVTRR